MKRTMAWLATAATLTFATPLPAAQDDPRLTTLFAQLRQAPDAETANGVEQTIWAIWHDSGDSSVDAALAEGLRAMASRDKLGALEAFDHVVRLAPGFAEGWNKRATMHYLMGNYRASAADIEKTLALEPRHFGALSGLGLVRLALGEEAAALEAFEAALAVHPRMAGADSHIRTLREKLKGRPI